MATAQNYRYLFGPVRSRRLGLSLGIDVVPMKTCTFNCIYCQLGRTTYQTIEREEYVPTAAVMDELTTFLASGGKVDYLTFSGSGEPTLHSKLGEMIAQTKKMSTRPVAVLTCGSLLFDPQVRRELAQADLVLPSLDAASPKTFRDINRPHGRLSLARIIDGLKRFRKEYGGQIWLEIMLVKGVNDDAEEITWLRKTVKEIKPDKVHLNTVVRPPAESEVEALTEAELQALAPAFDPPAEVIAHKSGIAKLPGGDPLLSDVVNMIARHPATLEEIAESVNCNHELVWLALNALIEAGAAETRTHQDKKFYTATSYAKKFMT
ncbi:MAG: radical SAM protein [candidate division KSB1 bacterium]|nr:radical SAM protein [candidate division KSB1 bacterium]